MLLEKEKAKAEKRGTKLKTEIKRDDGETQLHFPTMKSSSLRIYVRLREREWGFLNDKLHMREKRVFLNEKKMTVSWVRNNLEVRFLGKNKKYSVAV